MSRISSLVLLSGGLDSAANLALCVERDEPVLALTIHYGQRAAMPEIAAARALCEYYRVEHRVVDLPWLGQLGGSALTQPGLEIPDLRPESLDDRALSLKSAHAVWVPNRNGVLINVAASFAERLKISRVVVGFNVEEAATFPDNSADFLNRSTHALALSTATRCEVFCYTLELSKMEIVNKARALDRPFPFDKIWSCYTAGPTACGQCESCRRNIRAMGERS
jgi:7-cyano-7-deazaguanine synthase